MPTPCTTHIHKPQEPKSFRVTRATSRECVKRIALQYAKDTRHHPFDRVSAQFLDNVEAAAMSVIRRMVDQHPSKGKTLTA